jgi:hypothetical protein
VQKRDSGVGLERGHKRLLGPLPLSSKRFNPNSSRAPLALPIFEKGKRPTIFLLGHCDEHSAAGEKRHEFDEHGTSFHGREIHLLFQIVATNVATAVLVLERRPLMPSFRISWAFRSTGHIGCWPECRQGREI